MFRNMNGRAKPTAAPMTKPHALLISHMADQAEDHCVRERDQQHAR